MSEFISLYSGSSGNSSVVRCGDHYLIIDMGKGVRTTGAALKSLGLNIADCDGILVTHEHSDHVKGLSTFLKKNPLPVYGGADTLDFLDANGIVPPTCELNTLSSREEDIGAFGVQAFPTSHDVPCVGYRIHTPDGKTMTLATDLGVLTPPVHEALSGCDLVALESNYDLHSAAARIPITYAPGSNRPGATSPTMSAPPSCWSSFRRAAKSLPCVISRRRTTPRCWRYRPFSTPLVPRVSCPRKTVLCRPSAAMKSARCWNFKWDQRTPPKQVLHLPWRGFSASCLSGSLCRNYSLAFCARMSSPTKLNGTKADRRLEIFSV